MTQRANARPGFNAAAATPPKASTPACVARSSRTRRPFALYTNIRRAANLSSMSAPRRSGATAKNRPRTVFDPAALQLPTGLTI